MDETAFRNDQQAMNFLKSKEDDGTICLRYFDESGFSLTPSVPYGWQTTGQTTRISCQRSQRQNVLGFLGRQGEFFYQMMDKNVTTETVIACFDAFSKQYDEHEFLHHGKPCFVVMDNASMHRSAAFKEREADWWRRGVIPCYIPPYSPELNLIEILWRKMKYEWLPLSAFQDVIQLKYWLNNILEGVGKEYQISFA